MNILITQNKDIQILSKIYYFIFLLIVLTVLTSLIFANDFYQKSTIVVDKSINSYEKDTATLYINDLYTVKSLQQNKFIENFQIDHIYQ